MQKAHKIKLTAHAVSKLEVRSACYIVWDTQLAGFGVKVYPSRRKSYIFQKRLLGRQVKKHIGDAALLCADDARQNTLKLIATLNTQGAKPPSLCVPTLASFMQEPIGSIYKQNRKAFNRDNGAPTYLRTQIMPHFGRYRLDEITPRKLLEWFDSYSQTSPGGANRALDILRAIMAHAVKRGLIEENPTLSIKHNPKRTINRFLSKAEIGRLYRVLAYEERHFPRNRPAVDIIRLLLLTGCRLSEICFLKWENIDEQLIHLQDSKTGARDIILTQPVKHIITRQKHNRHKNSPYIFPKPRDPMQPLYPIDYVWHKIRKAAGLEDVRLHDLRHSYASQALLHNVPLMVVSKLLGHKDPRMTLRYAHVNDTAINEAAQRVADSIDKAMNTKPAKNTLIDW